MLASDLVGWLVLATASGALLYIMAMLINLFYYMRKWDQEKKRRKEIQRVMLEAV
jgi:hypothetical protein